MQGTLFRAGLSQGCESLEKKRLGTAHTTDSSHSPTFKRARTTSSALLDLLPLASDASTLDPRYTSNVPATKMHYTDLHWQTQRSSWAGHTPQTTAAAGPSSGLTQSAQPFWTCWSSALMPAPLTPDVTPENPFLHSVLHEKAMWMSLHSAWAFDPRCEIKSLPVKVREQYFKSTLGSLSACH